MPCLLPIKVISLAKKEISIYNNNHNNNQITKTRVWPTVYRYKILRLMLLIMRVVSRISTSWVKRAWDNQLKTSQLVSQQQNFKIKLKRIWHEHHYRWCLVKSSTNWVVLRERWRSFSKQNWRRQLKKLKSIGSGWWLLQWCQGYDWSQNF